MCMYVIIGGYNYHNMFCHLPLLSDIYFSPHLPLQASF